MTVSRFKNAFRAHWFFLAAAVVVISDFAAASLDGWSDPALLEAELGCRSGPPA